MVEVNRVALAAYMAVGAHAGDVTDEAALGSGRPELERRLAEAAATYIADASIQEAGVLLEEYLATIIRPGVGGAPCLICKAIGDALSDAIAAVVADADARGEVPPSFRP